MFMGFNFIDICFIVGIVFVGIISSYTDIKFGKIKNRVLKITLIYAFLINILALIIYDDVNYSAYFHYIINSLSILLISFVLWMSGLWTAGDAKLFFVISLLSPPQFFDVGYKGYFYGLMYFMNIFSVVLIYFTIRMIQKISLEELKFALIKTFNFKNLLSIIFFMYSFSFVMRFVPVFITGNFFITMMIFFLIYSILLGVFKVHFFKFVVVMGVLRTIMDFKSIITTEFWITYLKQILFFIFLRFILLRLSYYAFTKKIPLEQLKKKMFLAEDIVPASFHEHDVERKSEMEQNGDDFIRYITLIIENLTFISYLRSDNFKHIDYNKNLGLSNKNLKWFKDNKSKFLFENIRVYETMPFAPIIFVGVMITILVKGNLFFFLTNLVIKIITYLPFA